VPWRRGPAVGRRKQKLWWPSLTRKMGAASVAYGCVIFQMLRRQACMLSWKRQLNPAVCPHRWVGIVRRFRRERIQAQGDNFETAQAVPFRAPPEGALGCLVVKALAAWNPSRRCQSGPLGLLSRRVYFSLQPTQVTFSGQGVLSPASTGCCCRTGTLQRHRWRYVEPAKTTTYWGNWSQINTPININRLGGRPSRAPLSVRN